MEPVAALRGEELVSWAVTVIPLPFQVHALPIPAVQGWAYMGTLHRTQTHDRQALFH